MRKRTSVYNKGQSAHLCCLHRRLLFKQEGHAVSSITLVKDLTRPTFHSVRLGKRGSKTVLIVNKPQVVVKNFRFYFVKEFDYTA